MQMMTVASQRPSDSIDILIQNFGTDLWLGIFTHSITSEQFDDTSQVIPGSAGSKLKAGLFDKVPRFDAAKLGTQVRQLLL